MLGEDLSKTTRNLCLWQMVARRDAFELVAAVENQLSACRSIHGTHVLVTRFVAFTVAKAPQNEYRSIDSCPRVGACGARPITSRTLRFNVVWAVLGKLLRGVRGCNRHAGREVDHPKRIERATEHHCRQRLR